MTWLFIGDERKILTSLQHGADITVFPWVYLYTIIDFCFRSTHDHEDLVRYWLTDAVPDKFFMVNQYLTRSPWS